MLVNCETHTSAFRHRASKLWIIYSICRNPCIICVTLPHPDHSSLYTITDSSYLIYFLWAVFIVAQDCTIDVRSLAVFPRWINRTNQVFFTVATTKAEDAFLYLRTMEMLITNTTVWQCPTTTTTTNMITTTTEILVRVDNCQLEKATHCQISFE